MVTGSLFLKERRDAFLLELEKNVVGFFRKGVSSIYEHVKKNNKNKKYLLKEFQYAIRNISQWSEEIKQLEWERCIESCNKDINKIIQTLFKLNINILKGFRPTEIPKSSDYMYECYLNIARNLWSDPYVIFDIGLDAMERKKRSRDLDKMILKCIKNTFYDMIRLQDDAEDIEESIMESHRDSTETDIEMDKHNEGNADIEYEENKTEDIESEDEEHNDDVDSNIEYEKNKTEEEDIESEDEDNETEEEDIESEDEDNKTEEEDIESEEEHNDDDDVNIEHEENNTKDIESESEKKEMNNNNIESKSEDKEVVNTIETINEETLDEPKPKSNNIKIVNIDLPISSKKPIKSLIEKTKEVKRRLMKPREDSFF